MKAVEIYIMNEGRVYEAYALKYVGSDVIIKVFNTRIGAEKYATKHGYPLEVSKCI